MSRVRGVRVSHGLDSDHRPISCAIKFQPGHEVRTDQLKRRKLNVHKLGYTRASEDGGEMVPNEDTAKYQQKRIEMLAGIESPDRDINWPKSWFRRVLRFSG